MKQTQPTNHFKSIRAAISVQHEFEQEQWKKYDHYFFSDGLCIFMKHANGKKLQIYANDKNIIVYLRNRVIKTQTI